MDKIGKITERERRDKPGYEFNRNWRVARAREHCRRLDLALEGEDWLWHNELCHIWTQLLRVEGGTAVMRQILSARDGHSEGGYERGFKKEDFDPSWGYQTHYLYENGQFWSCNNALAPCPCLDDCHSKSIISAGLERSRPVRLRKDETITLPEAREEMQQQLTTALQSPKKVRVIKGDCGVGKTFTYMHAMVEMAAMEHRRVIYACPTHRLGRQVFSDLLSRRAGFDVFYLCEVEQHMPEAARRRVQTLYCIGAHKKAAAIKNGWLEDAYHEIQQVPENELSEKDRDIKDHWEARDALEQKGRGNCIIIMTHARYMCTPDIAGDIVFIDEDIMSRHLLPVQDFCIQDLERLYQGMLEHNIKGSDSIKFLLDELHEAPTDTVIPVQKASLFHSDDIVELLTTNTVHLSEESAVLKFLSGNTVAYAKSGFHAHHNRVFFIQNNRDNLADIPVVIASATLNRVLYERFFDDDLHWQEIPMIKYLGRLIQHPKKGYSNTSLRNALTRGNKSLLKEFQDKVGLCPCITTKEWKKTLERHDIEHNIIGTYGAIEGLNNHEGQNLVLWGTLHCPPVVYALFAYGLGRRVGIGDCFKEQIEIDRNNHRFLFNVYSDDELLQEIQLYMVEESMAQAAGRPRLCEHPHANVTVYSNFILAQAEIQG